jgi:hypothetical protein
MTKDQVEWASSEDAPKIFTPQMIKKQPGLILIFLSFFLGIIILISMMSVVAYWETGDHEKDSTMLSLYLEQMMSIVVCLSFLGLAFILRKKLIKGGPKKTALVTDRNPLGIWIVLLGTILGILAACIEMVLISRAYRLEVYEDIDRKTAQIMTVLAYAAFPVQMTGLALICFITTPLKTADNDAANYLEVGGFIGFLAGIIGISMILTGDMHDFVKFYSAMYALVTMGGVFMLSGIGLIITRGTRFEKLGTWRALGLSVCLFSLIPAVMGVVYGFIYNNATSIYYSFSQSTLVWYQTPLSLIGLSIIFYVQDEQQISPDLWKSRGLFFMVAGALFYTMNNYSFFNFYTYLYGSDTYLRFTLIPDGLNSLVTLILVVGLGLIIWRSNLPHKAGLKRPGPIVEAIVVQEEPAPKAPKPEVGPKGE